MYFDGMTTVAEQSGRFLAELEARRRNPVKPATLKAYSGYLRKWIVPTLGAVELGEIENGRMKAFVTVLVEKGLSPAYIAGVTTVLKALVGSETDGNGNKLHPREWNTGFIDAPVVNPEAQNTPVLGSAGLNAALQTANRRYQAFYALQAATGLRMGEMLALRMGPDQGSESYLDLEKGVVFVRSAMYDRAEQSTKSAAGVREVDLYKPMLPWLKERFDDKNQGDLLFCTRKGEVLHNKTLYEHFAKDGIPATHCLRRFRTTHLENMGVPRALVDYWTGHKGKTITDRYTKLGRSIRARKMWCKRAALGFQLPGTTENTVVYLAGDGETETEEVL